jgi:hypothetical protein
MRAIIPDDHYGAVSECSGLRCNAACTGAAGADTAADVLDLTFFQLA